MNPAASNGIEFYERENHVRYQEDAAGNLEKISLSPTPRDRGWIIGTTRCGHALRFQLVSEYTCMQIDLIFETRSFDNKNVSVGHLLIIKKCMAVKPIVRSSLGSVSLTIKCGKGRSLAHAIFLFLFCRLWPKINRTQFVKNVDSKGLH